MDVSNLTDDQVKIALKVIEAAEKHGVNPDFALAVAFAESSFNPKKPSKRGAKGVMQLMDSTAKELGVDSSDVDQNIDGGIRYLKEISSNPKIGADPIKVLAAYNAGPKKAGEVFEKGDVNEIPPATAIYIDRIFDISGGNLPPVFSGGESQEKGNPVLNSEDESVFDDAGDIPPSDANLGTEKTAAQKRGEAQFNAGVYGAGITTVKYPAIYGSQLASRAYKKAFEILGRPPVNTEEVMQVVNASQQPRESSTDPLKAGDKWGSKIGGPGGDTVKQASGNYRTERDLPPSIAAQFRVNRSGLLLPIDLDNPPPPPEPPPPRPNLVQRVNENTQKMAGSVGRGAQWTGNLALNALRSLPVRVGAAGASLAGNLQDFKTARENKDTTGQVIAGAGGLGAGASLVPKIGPVGGALAGAADTGRRVRESDYTGAAVSGGATAAPWIARAVWASELGPLGIIGAMTAPMIYDFIRHNANKRGTEESEAMKSPEDAAAYFQSLAPWER